MKRVLLTGAGGFIGHHTLEHLLKKTDWDVVCLDSFSHRGKTSRIREILDNLSMDAIGRVSVFTHDLRAPLDEQLIDRIGHIDYVINMASESHVDRSIDVPVPFVQNNVALVLNMLEYARTIKPEKFIQISTDEVYGAAEDGYDHKEWDTHKPSNPYAASKAAQEDIAYSYWRTYGVPLVITNTMNNFGERQDPEKFVPLLIRRISKGLKVQIHGVDRYETGSRFYLHARNHASALLWILENCRAGSYADGFHDPKRFNIVGEKEIKNFDLAQMVADHLGKKLEYDIVDFHAARPGHDRRYALDGERLRLAGWEQPMDFETSLASTIDWTLKHKEWL